MVNAFPFRAGGRCTRKKKAEHLDRKLREVVFFTPILQWGELKKRFECHLSPNRNFRNLTKWKAPLPFWETCCKTQKALCCWTSRDLSSALRLERPTKFMQTRLTQIKDCQLKSCNFYSIYFWVSVIISICNFSVVVIGSICWFLAFELGQIICLFRLQAALLSAVFCS